ncbi:MAG TPA: hypothetical protein VG275_00485 [Solirubrobacteraceae bacterium]|nr:hypothetical protein [Solirubrobacteraceae bacterium]
MNPRRNAIILIPVSVGVGIVAIALGSWPVFAFMVLSVTFQVASLVMIRRRRG